MSTQAHGKKLSADLNAAVDTAINARKVAGWGERDEMLRKSQEELGIALELVASFARDLNMALEILRGWYDYPGDPHESYDLTTQTEHFLERLQKEGRT